MKSAHLVIVLASLLLLSCSGKHADEHTNDAPQPAQQASLPVPSAHNFKIDVPQGWRRVDTTVKNVHVCFITPLDRQPPDMPRANMVVSAMDGKDINTFTTMSMNALKNGHGDVVIYENGKIKIGTIDAAWFTYSKVQNGRKSDMINYIIPVNGSAYMMTGGVNEGTMTRHRGLFDSMAASFRL